MTINVYAFPTHVPAGFKLQVVRRFPATGDETILSDDMQGHGAEMHHLSADCELIFREVKVEPVAVSPAVAPFDNMATFQSIKKVLAGEITEVVPAGCYVRDQDGRSVLRLFVHGMTARYHPKAGDFWLIYADGYQSISPRAAFIDGYHTLTPTT